MRTGKRALASMVTDAERGMSVRTNATAGDLLEAWFDPAVRDFSPKTVKETRGFIDGPPPAARRVALDSRTVGIVRAHRERMAERAELFGVALTASSFVFSNAVDGSESWYPDSVSLSFKRLCAEEGLSGVRLHDLRHVVATQLLSAGVDVRTVAGRLGHRNAATTLNVYAHFLEDSDRSAAGVIGKVIALEEGG